ncbi:RteC domain-containing protein [Agriterribacter sp.]|uniref:RteC domain-containing protein n=1 Tax=Agriterribacter sp. TaxID=2821509 RepID=UPI002BB279B5|nr:RteC domain-containing protein [Agriterribacter sp.]HRO46755.1 RteC domain-containing protein [Agriterribacter sp.]
MLPYTTKLYDRLAYLLNEIHNDSSNPIQQAGRSIRVCEQHIGELKLYIKQVHFKDSSEEIQFFKEIQPKFYCQYIYHVKIFSIEANRPIGSDKVQRKYLLHYMQRIQFFFDNNLEFYQYFRTGATHFDDVYFTRGSRAAPIIPDALSLFFDNDFCTVHSYKAAKLFANELLMDYLNTALLQLNNMAQEPISAAVLPVTLKWSASKVSLIELIYALQSTGAFKNGLADVKQIVSLFEMVFDISLGNVYNVFQEMRMRKKNRTCFIDLLRQKLIERMDEADDR